MSPALAARSARIEGSATLTMKASTTNMNWAATTIASANQRDVCPPVAVPGAYNGRMVMACDMALKLQCIRAALLIARSVQRSGKNELVVGDDAVLVVEHENFKAHREHAIGVGRNHLPSESD